VAEKLGAINLITRMYKSFGSYNGYFGQPYRMGQDTADVAVAWLERNGDRPFFVWTHFFDPHVPYHPPQEFRRKQDQGAAGKWYELDAKGRRELVESPEKVAAMIALYDAEVAYADAQLGRVVEAARAAAPGGNLLIVVTADHGESMGEHGLYWFRHVYDPTLLVPLVIVPPGSMSMPPAVVDTQVRLIDLVPTVLDMLDVDAGTTFDGSSLLALMRAGDGVSPGPAFSSRYSSSTEFSRERHAIRDRGWKLIHTKPGWDGGGATPLEGDSRELYELKADPGELSNLMDTGSAIQQQLEQQLDEAIGQGVALDLELTDEERERLRSLGYVQ
jgi:arylsulfatase A-like enzyme